MTLAVMYGSIFLPIFRAFEGETWKCAYNSVFYTKRLKWNYQREHL